MLNTYTSIFLSKQCIDAFRTKHYISIFLFLFWNSQLSFTLYETGMMTGPIEMVQNEFLAFVTSVKMWIQKMTKVLSCALNASMHKTLTSTAFLHISPSRRIIHNIHFLLCMLEDLYDIHVDEQFISHGTWWHLKGYMAAGLARNELFDPGLSFSDLKMNCSRAHTLLSLWTQLTQPWWKGQEGNVLSRIF